MTLADAIVPLALASPTRVTEGTGPVGNSRTGAPRGARATYDNAMELMLVLMWRPTAGGKAVSYAGPDRSETLP
ncbi:hypothetical protein GCM10027073_57490 [Streptomyces chlorus]